MKNTQVKHMYVECGIESNTARGRLDYSLQTHPHTTNVRAFQLYFIIISAITKLCVDLFLKFHAIRHGFILADGFNSIVLVHSTD